MSVRVTSVRNESMPRVHELLEVGLREQEAFAAECDPPEDDGFFDTEIAEYRDALESRRVEWYVALDDAESVVGVLWVRFDLDPLGRYGSVRQIIVDPEHRGRGIGTRLLHHAESLIRESDAVFFLISALRPNPAWRLYRRLGFSDFPHEFKEDKNPEHVVLWKWFGKADRPQTS